MTRFIALHKSDKPDKKYYAELVSSAGNTIRVYFGDSSAKDYTSFNPLVREEHKRRYLIRHQSREDWGASGRETPGFYARWILWNKPTIQASVADMKNRFF